MIKNNFFFFCPIMWLVNLKINMFKKQLEVETYSRQQLSDFSPKRVWLAVT